MVTSMIMLIKNYDMVFQNSVRRPLTSVELINTK